MTWCWEKKPRENGVKLALKSCFFSREFCRHLRWRPFNRVLMRLNFRAGANYFLIWWTQNREAVRWSIFGRKICTRKSLVPRRTDTDTQFKYLSTDAYQDRIWSDFYRAFSCFLFRKVHGARFDVLEALIILFTIVSSLIFFPDRLIGNCVPHWRVIMPSCIFCLVFLIKQ